MIDQTEATHLAAAYLAQVQEPETPLVLLPERTREHALGWVFFYTSAAYMQTNDPSDALAGNTPLVVDRLGGIHVTGTAYPVEHYLQELAQKLS